MSHEFETGFSVRETPWHNLATVLDEYPQDWGEARRLAGLDWEPIESPVLLGAPITPESIIDPTTVAAPQPIKDWKALTRSDTGELLHVHQDTYEVFPNAELGPLVETLLDEPDVQYETAGVLRGGRQVWVLVRLAEPFQIPGDPRGDTLAYLALQNSHDGSAALRAQRTQVRIVCANTSAAADRDASRHGAQYVFRHTKNMREYIAEARAAIAGLRDDRDNYRAWAADLLSLRITPGQRELFVTEFVPDPPSETLISKRVRNNIDRAREDLREILASETTQDTAHTVYGLVQASTEYLDHVRNARSDETRFNRTMLTDEPFKAKAEKLARQIQLVDA